MLLTLIQGLTKAEKRAFKLYVARLGSSSSQTKFFTLYRAIEKLQTLDTDTLLEECSDISKIQLPNLKAHLYKQLLISLSGLHSASDPVSEMRQMITFASVLLDKALSSEALRIADKAKEQALKYQCYTLALEIVEFEKRVELMYATQATSSRMELLSRQSNDLTAKISVVNELSNLAIQLYTLNLKLGYMRSKKDSQLIVSYFQTRINSFDAKTLSFHELLYYYQCRMWYSYIQYDFKSCYRWSKRWYDLYEANPQFKSLYSDMYIRAVSRLLEVLFLTNQPSAMQRLIDSMQKELEGGFAQNDRTEVSSNLALLLAKLNLQFLRCEFKEGLPLVGQIEDFLSKRGSSLEHHHTMLLYYKVACLYFGSGDYRSSINYLQKVITATNPKFRRDLQVFARILNLIASYEIGDDQTLDYQIRTVYSFIVKRNDMNAVQKAMLSFLRRITRVYASEFKGELQKLYNELKPLESHPFERRPFFYLDVISWLESKLSGRDIAQIRAEKMSGKR